MKPLNMMMAILLASQSALAQLKIETPKPKKEDKYLCSYTTRISAQDKINSFRNNPPIFFGGGIFTKRFHQKL